MKITKLETFLVPPRWCFLKIETDEGVAGWGEPVVEGRAASVAAAVAQPSRTWGNRREARRPFRCTTVLTACM